MKKLLVKNINKLYQVRENIQKPLRGKELNHVPCLENAWLAVEDGFIVDFGLMNDFPGISDWKDLNVIDAENKNVFPCFVDAHTHLVFAGNREQEFEWRLHGMTYQEIAQKGGGILNSAKLLQNTSEEELFLMAKKRVEMLIKMGTGAIEIKSGYGLTMESEIKMLHIIQELKKHFEIPIKATFLGAHAIPPHFQNRKNEYIQHIIDDMLPKIAEENLADFIDIFCEQNYFDYHDTLKILEAGQKYHLKGKVHAEQLSHTAGILAGVKMNALSVDHLEYANEEDLIALKNSNTIPVILPGAAYFLNLPPAPASKMIEYNLPIAIASDFNPGSSPSGNMSMMISLVCVMNKITPQQAYNAATVNAAFAMDLNNMGWIDRGNVANFFLTDKSVTPTSFAYHFAHPLIEEVFINGKKFVS
ncbi:MAG: imidazolonepropionase [Bacteroidia bacterium]|nr:MAG: imidazolonepropionase [Bacteroidia bacterium]